MIAALKQQASLWLPSARQPDFERKIEVDFVARDYRVKTIDSVHELRQVLGLRRSVFHYEFARKWISLKSDKDDFDDVADHLAIFDQKAKKIAGVYRLISSSFGRRFYASSEFDIGGILALPGNKLELSRACINREYRNGVVISLLWKGIAEYARAAQIDFLFGLSSVNTVDPLEIARLTRYFRGKNLIADEVCAEPRAKYRIDGFERWLARAEAEPAEMGDASDRVPSLMKTYIKAGARLCSQPVIDRDFQCADFLTLLDMRKLSGAYGRRYMQE